MTITSPTADSVFSDTASIPIVAVAADSDGTVVSVEFFVSDTVKIGQATSPPYSMVWRNIAPGAYTLTAVATDNQGHKRTSNRVPIRVGMPAMKKLEAEAAARAGSGMTVKSDPTASNGAFLDIATQTGTITWTLANVPSAGTYNIAFGYKLFYDHPKSQFINVNGVRAHTLTFDAPSGSTWYEKADTVTLVQGSNTIQMELSWGWMYLDYLAVPITVISSSEENPSGIPLRFALHQNYPNPFNPTTTIAFSLASRSIVALKVYDLLGREVATLVSDAMPAGKHIRQWNAGNVASGVYFYRLQARPADGAKGGSFVETRKLVVLR